MSNALSNVRIKASTLSDMLLLANDQFPDETALIFEASKQTYGQLTQASYARAAQLLGLGVGPGDHVGILMTNCEEYLELLFGALMLGACVVPINARYKAQELAYVVENADLSILVTSDLIADYTDFKRLLLAGFDELAHVQKADFALSAAPKLRHIVLLGSDVHPSMVTQEQFVSRGAQIGRDAVDALRVAVQLTDPAIMMYTSGTTAHPKGCPLSHALLSRNAANMNLSRYFLTHDDVLWAPLPMFHMGAILPLLACIDAGASFASMHHFEPEKALSMLEREGITIAFPAFPTITNDLITHKSFAATDLSKIRRINNVAPEQLLRRFQSAFPQAIQTGAYGLTEAGGVIAFNHPDESLEERIRHCGHPMPGIRVTVMDPDTFKPVPPGHKGEIWIKGYSVFQGYYKSPEKNEEAFYDGWFRTGDICSLSETGAITYHGRMKDMLKVGGENVAAIEIESHLSRYPGVQLAQVVGRPDDRLQEVPVAFIECEPEVVLTEEDLIAHCQGQLASFKVPRSIIFVDSWPMSSTKVQKFRLVEMLSESSSSNV